MAYTEKERLFGDVALTSIKSNADCTLRSFKHLLGVTSTKQNSDLIGIESQFSVIPFVENPELSSLCAYQISRTNDLITATEALAAFLKKMRILGENHIGAKVSGAVIAVPSWFSDVHRQAVLDACQLINLECLRVMSHSTATALDYGLFRSATFQADKPHVVTFVDVGYGAATVSVVEFLPSQLTILAVQEDCALGGRALDRIVVDYVREAFKKQTGLDCTKNKRAMVKLYEAGEKAKKVLSANKEANVHMECFMEDEDLNVTITREEFEVMCESYKQRLADVCAKAFAESGVQSPADLASVEICGGCTRVPFIQTVIEGVFQRAISRTVSSDECVARGAAVQAAMIDVNHKVKEFAIIDRRFQPVTMSFDSQQLVSGLQASEPLQITEGANSVCVFPSGNNSPYIKYIVVPQPLTQTPLVFELHSTDFAGNTIELGTYRVAVDAEAQAIMARAGPDKSTFKLRVCLNIHGMVVVTAYLTEHTTIEETYQEKVANPKPEDAGEDYVETFEMVTRTRSKPHKNKVSLPVSVHRPQGWLSEQQKQDILRKEIEFARKDFITEQSRHYRNEVLSTCFKFRQALADNSVYRQFASEQEVVQMLAEADQKEIWAEDNDDLSLEEYQNAYKSMIDMWNPIEERHRQDLAEKAAAEKAAAEAAAAERAAAEAAAAEAAAAEAAAAAAAAQTPASPVVEEPSSSDMQE